MRESRRCRGNIKKVQTKKVSTYRVGVEGRLVGGERGEVGRHAGRGGCVGVRRAVHGQRHARRQPLVVEQLVLARAHRLPRDGVLEYRAAGVAAARGRGGRAGPRRAAHPRLRRRRTVGGCRYGAL